MAYKQIEIKLHETGKCIFMQHINPEIQKAKDTIRLYFTDKHGRPLRKPYYITQIQTLLEKRHLPRIMYQAASQLVEDGYLLKSRDNPCPESCAPIFHSSSSSPLKGIQCDLRSVTL